MHQPHLEMLLLLNLWEELLKCGLGQHTSHKIKTDGQMCDIYNK